MTDPSGIEIPGGFAPRQSRQEVLIRQLQGMLGGRRLKVGTVTLTWVNGAQHSNVAVVNHGLGVTPAVVLISQNGVGGPVLTVVGVVSLGPVSFQAQASFFQGTASGTVNVNYGWTAIV